MVVDHKDGPAQRSRARPDLSERAEATMRFSVKCTREQNKYLIDLAAKIGMTPNELVQSAMDELLADFQPSSSSRGVSPPASPETIEYVMKALLERMDVRGMVSVSVSELCREIGMSGSLFYRGARDLVKAGRIEKMQNGGFNTKTVFRVKKAFD